MDESTEHNSPKDSPILGYVSQALPGEPLNAFRSGPYLVARGETFLPARCVLCNRKAVDPPVILSFNPVISHSIFSGEFWHTRWYETRVHASYCRRHLRRRRLAPLVVGVAVVLTAPFIEAATSKSTIMAQWIPPAIIFCGPILIGCFIFLYVARRQPHLAHSEGEYMYLRGCGQAFLSSLPPASEIPTPKD